MSVETTAFVTEIKYGAEPSASIYTKSGKVYEISIDSLLLLSQRKIDQTKDVGSLLGIPDISENPIMLLEVYYPSPLLQNGLVIVDTPGLNTLMQDHKERTELILPEASAVIYTLGKALSQSDLSIIKQIDGLGIEVIYVRTKLDEIRASENESIDDVLKHDYQKLKAALGKEPILFGISNEEHLLELEEWSRRFYDLKFYLEDELTSKVAFL